MSDLLDSYSPRWLYIPEFMDSLPGSDVAEKEEAVLLLIRDRLIVGGAIDEDQFRFLSGKPDIQDATWLDELSRDDVRWDASCIRAPANDSLLPRDWLPIEIAAEALDLFGSKENAKPRRTSPEQIRALRVLKALFGENTPHRDEITDTDLHKRVNDHIGKGDRAISKDTVMRAAGRRK